MSQTLDTESVLSQKQLYNLVWKIQDALANFCMSSGGLTIKTGSSALVKTATAVKYLIDGALYTVAAGDMAALSGTVTADKFNVFCFYVDADGDVTTQMGTEGASLAAVVFPTQVAGTAMIGYVIINPTGTGDFVGGTTALDDATVVPNAFYVNTAYPINFPATNAL